jgi:hypothetical protein
MVDDIIPKRQAASLRSQQRWGIVDTCPCGRSAAAANESVEPLPHVLNVARWDTMAPDPRGSNGLGAWRAHPASATRRSSPEVARSSEKASTMIKLAPFDLDPTSSR